MTVELEEILLRDIAYVALDWKAGANGDVDSHAGIKNLKAALLRRLLTSRGSFVYWPNYGVGIKNYQNAPLTLSVQRRLAMEIKEQFELDPRVEQVKSVVVYQDPTNTAMITILIKLDVAGIGDSQFQFEPIGEDAI